MLVPQQAADDVDYVVADNVPADDVADVVVDDVIADVVAHAAAKPTPPSPTPTSTPPPPQQEVTSTPPPSPHQSPVRTAQRVESSADTVMDDQEDTSKQGGIIAKIDVDKDVIMEEVDATKDVEVEKNVEDDEPEPAELKEVIKVVTTAKLMTEVVTAAATTIASTITAAPRKGILVEEPKPLKKQVQIEQDEAYARELEAELNKNINWDDVIEQVKKKGKQDNESRALKRQSESSKEKAVKKQKLDEEVEELKKHLQIIPNNDDDVYTEATPLALKVHVVDYEIHTENNKPYYKIIKADGTHQLFLSFLSLLRNFDREDLEVLWQIVKEIFASLKL
nr:hypothetical protein [Tanacetum cinerariifolium]